MNSQQRIFIVGRAGAGKGVVTAAVAKKLAWLNVNADWALEASIGRNLSELLTEEGGGSFQSVLDKILLNLTNKNKIVVCTDDLMVLSEESRKILSSEFTVYLKVSTDVQVERVGKTRPHFQVENYATYLDDLYKERDILCEQVASYSLSSDDGNIDKHASMIIKAYEEQA